MTVEPTQPSPSVVQRGDCFLDRKAVCKKLGIKAISTLNIMEKTKGFPSRIPVYSGRVVYLESEVERFMERMAARRDTSPQKDEK